MYIGVCIWVHMCVGVWVCMCIGEMEQGGGVFLGGFLFRSGLSLGSQGPKMPPSVPLLVVTRPSTSRKSTWIFQPALSPYRPCRHFLLLPLVITSPSR